MCVWSHHCLAALHRAVTFVSRQSTGKTIVTSEEATAWVVVVVVGSIRGRIGSKAEAGGTPCCVPGMYLGRDTPPLKTAWTQNQNLEILAPLALALDNSTSTPARGESSLVPVVLLSVAASSPALGSGLAGKKDRKWLPIAIQVFVESCSPNKAVSNAFL